MSENFDLLVIGTGTAGLSAAHATAAAGWKVGIVDALPYGGTCALRGCDPKKILRRGAEVVESAALMRDRGIVDDGLRIDWSALQRHKRGFTDAMSRQVEAGLEDGGVTTLHGTARFVGRDAVDIDGEVHRAERFLIASGAAPKPLDLPGSEHVIDSTAFLGLETLPERIVFIGGGFISFEFAHIAARAGAQCTILSRSERPLRGFDPDLVDRLVERTRSAGIDVRLSTTPASVRQTTSGAFDIQMAGTDDAVEADLVVHGAGRAPALDGLELDAAQVAHDDRGVTVHPHLQSTTNSAVWAAGDAAATRGRPLTPVASSEGSVAASNMLTGAETAPDYTGVSSTVFTIPELTGVGMTEAAAREAGHHIDVRFSDTGSWYSNYRVGEKAAAAKIIVDADDDRILGAHLFGPEYAEAVNVFSMAIALGLTAEQLRAMPASYPSVGSDVASML